eukprot:526160-Alexandrium_andersonii.AAC.1
MVVQRPHLQGLRGNDPCLAAPALGEHRRRAHQGVLASADGACADTARARKESLRRAGLNPLLQDPQLREAAPDALRWAVIAVAALQRLPRLAELGQS